MQQVGKLFPGPNNVRPFSCIKSSKLARFSFDISLPQYGYPTKVNTWSQFKIQSFIWLICSLVQKIESRFVAGRSRFATGRSRFVAGRKNNNGGAKRGALADSHPGPRTKVNAMSKEDISEKKKN